MIISCKINFLQKNISNYVIRTVFCKRNQVIVYHFSVKQRVIGGYTKKKMKKYFKFTTLRKTWKSFVVVMIAYIVRRFKNSHMSIGEIIITHLIVAAIYVFATLVVDWVQMKSDSSKDKDSTE